MSLGTYVTVLSMLERGCNDARRAGEEAAGRMRERNARKARLAELEQLQARVVAGQAVDLRSDDEKRQDAGWDEAAKQAATVDFLLNYVKKLVPDHPLVKDPRFLEAVGNVGAENFKRNGRRSLDDARVSTRCGARDVLNDWSKWGVTRKPT